MQLLGRLDERLAQRLMHLEEGSKPLIEPLHLGHCAVCHPHGLGDVRPELGEAVVTAAPRRRLDLGGLRLVGEEEATRGLTWLVHRDGLGSWWLRSTPPRLEPAPRRRHPRLRRPPHRAPRLHLVERLILPAQSLWPVLVLVGRSLQPVERLFQRVDPILTAARPPPVDGDREPRYPVRLPQPASRGRTRRPVRTTGVSP